MKKKLVKIAVLIAGLLLIVTVFRKEALAERVHGHGANLSGADAYRTYNFKDRTVKPPLGLSWAFRDESGIPVAKGFGLTNYRIYFGKNHSIYGLNDQTGSAANTGYAVGNPFIKKFNSAAYGSVTSAAQLLSTYNAKDAWESLYVGTRYSYVMKLDGFGRKDKQGDQTLKHTKKLYGGAIEYLNRTGSSHYILAASHRRLHLIDTDTMTRKWWYDGGEFTGITKLPHAMLVVTDNGILPDDGRALIYRYAYKKSGGSVKPDTTIKYLAGIPKAPAYDSATNSIYTVDREGRIYIHRPNGNELDVGYVGDQKIRGYNSVGGVLVTSNHVYASSEGSSKGSSRGTITRFSKYDVDQKTWYVHNAPITTTPIFLSGLIYFGDANGKVWALNPKTMEPVRWYLDESISRPQFSYDIGGTVKYIMGADNHLIAASHSGIYGFKGRPDFLASYQKTNGKAANGSRFNFTDSTPPVIKIENNIANRGTFDYEVYDDFGGSSTQYAKMTLKNLDSGKTVVLNENRFTNNVPDNYKSDSNPGNPHRFQVPVDRSFSLFYSFHSPGEGRYRLTTIANYGDKKQREFGRFSDRKTSVFDVVDMRPPRIQARKTTVEQTAVNTFDLSITQKYSESRYKFMIQNPSGNVVFSKSHTGRPPASVKWTIPDNAKTGTYHYFLQIRNRYGNTLRSRVKAFTVVSNNHPPSVKLDFLPSSPYEGDDIRLLNLSQDPDQDQLKAKWAITDPTGRVSKVSDWETSIQDAKPGIYRVRLVVTDPDGANDSVTVELKVFPLSIAGKVLHTPGWKQIHEDNEDFPNAFYSGESFVLQAVVTDEPVVDVRVDFTGRQMNGNVLRLSKELSPRTPTLWAGKLYDDRMTAPDTRLVDGPAYFTFVVHYKNGVVKSDRVVVKIIGSVYDSMNFHRSF